jgi:hypothetical protein
MGANSRNPDLAALDYSCCKKRISSQLERSKARVWGKPFGCFPLYGVNFTRTRPKYHSSPQKCARSPQSMPPHCPALPLTSASAFNLVILHSSHSLTTFVAALLRVSLTVDRPSSTPDSVLNHYEIRKVVSRSFHIRQHKKAILLCDESYLHI